MSACGQKRTSLPIPLVLGCPKTLNVAIGQLQADGLIYPLCDLDGVGRVTARSLYEAESRTKSQVLASAPQALATVRGIGPTLAARILGSKTE